MIEFKVDRLYTQILSDPITVNLAVSGTANYPSDYTVSGATTFSSTNATLIIPSGAISASIFIAVVSDTFVEANESIILTLIPSDGIYELGSNTTATGTILNDDVAY